MSIIEVKNATVEYITGDIKNIGIKDFFIKKAKGNYDIQKFLSIDDVSFSLEKGELLGIIGTNGAGKSTLLRLLSGIMSPSSGSVIVRGSVAALLELGTGFDGDLSVKENIFLRGAMLGYTKSHLTEIFNEIIEFAELTEFVDREFKKLSSGMKSRLAFSVSSFVDPDVLILDEVLSVGDGVFKKKSEQKMKDLIYGGATTVLVSHSLEQIRDICTKVLWIEKGKKVLFGEVGEVCNEYAQFLEKKAIK
jgi:ABC-2 type transport system ATP-binding protein